MAAAPPAHRATLSEVLPFSVRSEPVSGETCEFGLFRKLWASEDFAYRLENLAKGEPRLHLPHTVVYKNSVPVEWYFTAKDGTYKRRKPKSRSREEIMRVLGGTGKGSEAVCYFASVAADPHTGQRNLRVQHMNYAALETFARLAILYISHSVPIFFYLHALLKL